MTLRDYVRRRIDEQGLQRKDITQRGSDHISAGYINDILSGKADNPTVKKLKALAVVLDVSEDEIFDVARGKNTPLGESERLVKRITEKFPLLGEKDKAEVRPFLKATLNIIDAKIRARKGINHA